MTTNGIGFLNFWCYKVLPLVYDESLSYYEVLCKAMEKINEIITSQNQTNENVTELQNAFNELKNYVDNYFTNLDVQEEINKKLDAMLTDGSLDPILQRTKVYNSLGLYVNTTTDISDYLTQLDTIGNAGLPAGTYTVNKAITLNNQIVLAGGVTLNGSGKITFAKAPNAPRNIHLNVNVEINSGVVCPEWFGAINDDVTDNKTSIQKCVNSCNNCTINFLPGLVFYNVNNDNQFTTKGAYYVSSEILISKSELKMVNGTLSSKTAQNIINIQGSSQNPTNFIEHIEVKNMKIVALAGNTVSCALRYLQAKSCFANDVIVYGCLECLKIVDCVNIYPTDILFRQWRTELLPGNNVFIGLYGVNSYVGSCVFTRCTASFQPSNQSNKIGILFSKGVVNDNIFTNIEVGGATIGVDLGPEIKQLWDTFIVNSIFDSIQGYAFRLNGLDPQSSLLVDGCWINSNGYDIFLLSKSNNITITNCEIHANNLNSYFVYADASSGLVITQNMINGLQKGINLNVSNYCTISNNNFMGNSVNANNPAIECNGMGNNFIGNVSASDVYSVPANFGPKSNKNNFVYNAINAQGAVINTGSENTVINNIPS